MPDRDGFRLSPNENRINWAGVNGLFLPDGVVANLALDIEQLRNLLRDAREVLWTIMLDSTEYHQAGPMVEAIDKALPERGGNEQSQR